MKKKCVLCGCKDHWLIGCNNHTKKCDCKVDTKKHKNL